MQAATKKSTRQAPHGLGYEVLYGAVGGLGGAGLGAVAAGLPAAVAGAIIGAGAGALAGWASAAQRAEVSQHDSRLDEDIGVTGHDLGVPELEHPPSRVGAFSKETAGAGTSVNTTEAAGPIGRAPE